MEIWCTSSTGTQGLVQVHFPASHGPGSITQFPLWFSEDLARLLAGLRTLAGVDTVRGIHIGVSADTAQRGIVDGSYSASLLLFFGDVAGTPFRCS